MSFTGVTLFVNYILNASYLACNTFNTFTSHADKCLSPTCITFLVVLVIILPTHNVVALAILAKMDYNPFSYKFGRQYQHYFSIAGNLVLVLVYPLSDGDIVLISLRIP